MANIICGVLVLKNKIFIRILLSGLVLILAAILIEHYSDGSFKNILWGLSIAIVLLYNRKKNIEYKESKDSN